MKRPQTQTNYTGLVPMIRNAAVNTSKFKTCIVVAIGRIYTGASIRSRVNPYKAVRTK